MDLFVNPFQYVYQKLFGQQPNIAKHCDRPIELNMKSDPDPTSSLKPETPEILSNDLKGPNVGMGFSIIYRDSGTQTDLPSSSLNLDRKMTIDDSLQPQRHRRGKKQKQLMLVQRGGSSYAQRKRSKCNQSTALHLKRKKENVKNFIIFHYINDTPMSILSRTAKDHRVKLKYKMHRNQTGYECTVLFNNAQLAQTVASSSEQAKTNAALTGLQNLQKYDSTIKVSSRGFKLIHKNDFENLSIEQPSNRLDHHNIGFKMMNLMGWCDTQGLGKSSQGILQPIIPVLKLKRGGLGSVDNKQQSVFVQTCLNILESYIRENTLDEVEFCSFANEEMCLIEYAAHRLGLQTRRLGKVNRVVRVMKMRTAEEKLKFLRKSGGLFGNYELIRPTVRDYYQ